MEFITELVQEQGITDIIFEYKKQFEYRDIIERYNNDWNKISILDDITEDFVYTYQYDICWRDLIIYNHQNYDDDFLYWMTEDKDFCWDELLYHNDVDIKIVLRFKECFDWYLYSIEEDLSELFMRKYYSFLYWDVISEHQYLSENFIRQFRDLLDIDKILNNPHLNLSNEFRQWLLQ
jgi:hypothetical protein